MPAVVNREPQLSEGQKTDLTLKLNDLRLQNEQYLRQHPEIKHILGYLLRNLLHDRPEQVPDYIASLLTDSDLRSKVDADTQAQQELHQWHLQMFQKLAEVNGN